MIEQRLLKRPLLEALPQSFGDDGNLGKINVEGPEGAWDKLSEASTAFRSSTVFSDQNADFKIPVFFFTWGGSHPDVNKSNCHHM